jgi:hypothetical protein
MSEEGIQAGAGTETKPRRKRRSPDYVLQELVEQKDSDTSPNVWRDAKDGFVSPEQALAHIEKAKLEGVYRVVRQASDVIRGSLKTPEPVYTIEKVETKKNG